MQLLLLGMLMGVFLYDEGVLRLDDASPPAWFIGASVLGTKLLLIGGYAFWARRTYKALGTRPGAGRMKRLETLTTALPLVLLAAYLGDLLLGWPDAVRRGTGNPVLLDEVVIMTPTLLAVLGSWWAYYPVDRRLREASLIRRADAGLPIYPVWTRGQFVLAQARMQLLVIFVPLLLILAWAESLEVMAAQGWVAWRAVPWLTPAGAGVLFLFTPLALRHVFDTVPLPAGPVRERMAALCRTHGVGVRNLLLWRTYGGMINAAVMGLVAPLRYILLTDGLLDQVREDHVEAVMAHELGHVKHRHLVWLLLAAVALMGVCFGSAEVYLSWAADDATREAGAIGAAAVAWALAFGWVSRRVERQADTFAAKHLSTAVLCDRPELRRTDETPPTDFSPAAVDAVAQALQRVADLNHVSATRRSWRHGSIAARQRYLRSLAGTPLGRASVDRVMAGVNAGSVAVVVALIGWSYWG